MWTTQDSHIWISIPAVEATCDPAAESIVIGSCREIASIDVPTLSTAALVRFMCSAFDTQDEFAELAAGAVGAAFDAADFVMRRFGAMD